MKNGIQLTTPRVQMRSITKGDAELLNAFEVANIEHFSLYAPAQEAVSDSLVFLEKKVFEYLEEQTRGSSIRLLLFDRKALEGPVIGICNFTQIFRGFFQACYLGYKIDKLYEGKGVMSESLEGACSYMFKKENLHRIMANYIPSNERSEKLLNRLGFQKEGYAKEYLFINGIWEDHILTSLTNHSWRQAEKRL